MYTVFCLNVFVYCMHAWSPQTGEDDSGAPGTRATDCRSWHLNLGPLEDQPVLLITELSRQPLSCDL